ncbi:hypothetical protein JZO70_05485 [Enterococcus sp. 669A]|uniref:Uncharacterized protein n=1 Tax=Candidatus Enterococcus moelleringii TaxID=2815325 RepID=A0ABS3L7M0_9ENTE|nr:hypothetical protein [Enterococcus sp. 669A]MBO1305600.1 hypothetical protein [Enterococcus sp. 669A]
MFGFGKQKKEAYQKAPEEEYFYDEYDAEGYDDDYGYETYPAEGYERPAEYDRGDRRNRSRKDDYREESFEEGTNQRTDNRPRPEEQLEQEVERLTETVSQLKQQLDSKHTELTTMAAALTEKEQQIQDLKTEKDQQLEQLRTQKDKQIDRLENQLEERQSKESTELDEAKKQIVELKKAQAASEGMKDELANILVESKKQEKQILERAEYEANGIRNQAQQDADQMLHDSALELRVMKQEIKNYRKRLRVVQEETAQFFVKLLANSDTLLDEE